MATFLALAFLTILGNVWTLEMIESLKKMAVTPHPMTVSGFSSGASMAQQLHISSSGRFDGMGAFAGVFYRCTGETKNNSICWGGNTKVSRSIKDALGYESKGLIDPLSNLKNQKVFFWIGVMDDGKPQMSTRFGIVSFYQNFIHNPSRIHTKMQSAYHLMPTNYVSQPCTAKPKPPYNYLANCNYSGSYEALNFLIGPSIVPPPPTTKLQPLRLFNQSEFFGSQTSADIGLDEVGFLYVPTHCGAGNSCLLHIFLHGCTIQRELMNATFIEKSGFMEVGEANNVIMLFPQAISIKGVNPYGCWDYEGFTGPYFATRKGVQIVAINKMVSRLLFGKDKDGNDNGGDNGNGGGRGNHAGKNVSIGLWSFLAVLVLLGNL